MNDFSLAPAGVAVRTAYAIQHVFTKTFWNSSRWTNHIVSAARYTSQTSAVEGIRQMDASIGSRTAVQIVRVTRTTVPGAVVVGKTERRLWQEGEYRTGTLFALDIVGCGFLGTADKYSNRHRTLDEATLFVNETEALTAIQTHARNTQMNWYTVLTRVWETITPSSTAPDTVTDVVTVLE